jgi:virginiamycin B lyase
MRERLRMIPTCVLRRTKGVIMLSVFNRLLNPKSRNISPALLVLPQSGRYCVWLILALALPAISSAQWIRYTNYVVGTPTILSDGAVPQGITAGPDGAMWFTGGCTGFLIVSCNDTIGRITTSGTVTSFPVLSADANSTSIAVGADGAMWFTENGVNKIGRITTSGVVTEYPIPTVNSAPFAIVAGPDSALWFTEFSGNKIGRITVTGSITEYTIPTPISEPEGIALGSDGALWFAEDNGNNSNNIGRVTTSGSFTEFARPNERLSFITSGPDGALWFTESNPTTGSQHIGRITTGGTVTEYPVPAAFGATLNGIKTGPDGALWFTLPSYISTAYTGLIGRMTTLGDVTEFPTPQLGELFEGLTAIAVGPDGNMWYTDGVNNIVKAPACGLGLTLTYAPSTLTLGFDLGIYIPGTGQGTWGIWLVTNGIKKLWSQTGPSVAPVEHFTIPIPNFPSVGNVGVISILTNPAGLACSDLQFVNTDGTGMSIDELRNIIRSSGIVPTLP